MVFGIGDVEIVAGESQALRTIKRRFIECAISRAGVTSAHCLHEGAVKFGDNDPIVI